MLDATWHVEPKLNRVSCGGKHVRIPDKFMQVLVCLAEQGDVVSRDELMHRVWPNTFVVEESLTRAISELRKVFGDSSRNPRVIETIPKKGYRLLVSVTWDDASPRADSPVKRWPGALILIGLLVIVIGVLGVGRHLRSKRVRSEPHVRYLTSLQGRERHPALSPDGTRLAFVWDGGDSLDPAVMVMALSGGPSIQLTRQVGTYAAPAWSHDGSRVAYVRLDPEPAGIYQVAAHGGMETLLVPTHHQRPPVTPDYSPDGSWLAFSEEVAVGGPHTIFLHELDTQETRRLIEHVLPDDYDYRPRFSPDGKRIAFIRIRPDATTIEVMLLDGREVKTLHPGEEQLIDIAWAPGGRDLIYLAIDGIWRQSVAGGPPQNIKPGVHPWQSSLAVARDAPLLVYTQSDVERNIWLYDPDHASATSQLIGSSRYDALPAYSPDGRRIAFVSDRSGARQVWVAAADGASPRQMTDYGGCLVLDPAWSPDGRTLAFLAYPNAWAHLNLIDVRSGVIRTISRSPSLDSAPCWSVDGRHIYFASNRSGESRIWKISVDGEQLLPATTGDGYRPRVSPDGEVLYFRKDAADSLGVWRQPTGGGRAELVFGAGAMRLTDWCLRHGGVYFCQVRASNRSLYDFGWFDDATGAVSILFQIESRLSPHMDLHPDGRRLVFDRTSRYECDLVGYEGFQSDRN